MLERPPTLQLVILGFTVATGPARAGVPLSGAAFEIERRLQHLEEAESTIRSELEHVRR
jgi:hypothetical protein